MVIITAIIISIIVLIILIIIIIIIKKKKKKKNEKKRLQVSKKDVIAGLKSGKMILLKKTEFNKRTKSNDKHWKAFRHVVYADGLHKGDAVYGSRNGYWVFCDDCKDYGEGLLDLNADSTTNTMNSHLKKCGKNNSNHNTISSYWGAKDTNATDTTLQFSETEKLQIRKDCVELVALNKRSFKIVKDEGVVSICHRFYNLGVKHGIYAKDKSQIEDALPHPTTVSKDVATEGKQARFDFIQKVLFEELEKEVPAFGLTADLWKEKYTQSYYIGITLAFWAEDGESIQTLFLACKGWKDQCEKLNNNNILLENAN
eukprot:178424_1